MSSLNAHAEKVNPPMPETVRSVGIVQRLAQVLADAVHCRNGQPAIGLSELSVKDRIWYRYTVQSLIAMYREMSDAPAPVVMVLPPEPKPWPKAIERWNDPRPRVTAVVRAAMLDGSCGEPLGAFLNGLTNDEQLAIAHTIANVTISAYCRDLAEGGR